MTSLGASAWPMYQHDLGHTGRSNHSGITSAPLVLWKKQLTGFCGEVGTGMSRALDGTVYISGCGHLYALEPQAGSIKWDVSGLYSRSTPAVDSEGMLYWGFADSFAAITSTGQIDWSVSGLSSNLVFGSSPVIAQDGTIYFNHDGLWAFNNDGTLKWVYGFGGWSHASPAIGPDGTIYTTAIMAFTPEGSVKWSHAVGQDQSPSVGDDGTVYVGDNQARLFAFNPDGTEKWVFASQDSLESIEVPPTIGGDGTIYFGTAYSGGIADKVYVYAVKPDGSFKWKYTISGGGEIAFCICAPLVVDADQRVFVCADNGWCYGLSATGTLLWSYDTQPLGPGAVRTAPLITADGKILVLDNTLTVHALAEAVARLYVPMLRR